MRIEGAARVPAAARSVSWRVPAAVCLLVIAVLLPFGLNNYWLRLITTGLMFGGLAHALNLMVGLAGWPALGNVVFFGLGGYGTAVLSTRLGAPPLVAIAFGAVLASMCALAASRAMLSLRGSHFLMATVALNYAVLEFVVVAKGLTNGPQGITLAPLFDGPPDVVYRMFFYLFLAVVGVSTLVLLAMRGSRLGYGLLAIKGNEDAALMLGVPVFRYKAVAWAVSAALSGLIGGIYAYWVGFIDPRTVFDLGISLEVFLMVLLGGRLIVVGPIVGALAYEIIAVSAWGRFQEARLAVLGALLVGLVVFLPGGVPDLLDRLTTFRSRLRSRRDAP